MLASNVTNSLSNGFQWNRAETVHNESTATMKEQEQVLVRLEWISRLFDEAYRIPGTSIRLGWDALLGLIPLVGDGATTLVSAYYLWEAHRLGALKRVLAKMLWNVCVDFCVGTIPLVGDLVDVAWRANRKNMKVLVRELQMLGKLPTDTNKPRLARLIERHGARQSTGWVSPRAVARLWPLMMP